MTDNLAVGTITQLTETGQITLSPLARYLVDMTQFAKPDPRDGCIAELEAIRESDRAYKRIANVLLGRRDARIAELEAEIEASDGAGVLVIEVARQRDAEYKARIVQLEEALGDIVKMCDTARGASNASGYLAAIGRFATIALMPAPERDMTMTVEELDA